MIRIVDEEYTVADNYPDHDNNPLERRNRKRGVGQKQHPEDTHNAERNGEHNNKWIEQGLELRGHDHVHEHDRESECEQEVEERLLLLLYVSGLFHFKPGRDADPLDPVRYVACNTAKVTAADIGGDFHQPLLILPVNLHRRGGKLYFRNVPEPDLLAAGCGHDNVLKIGNFRAEILTQTHQDVVLITRDRVGI